MGGDLSKAPKAFDTDGMLEDMKLATEALGRQDSGSSIDKKECEELEKLKKSMADCRLT